MGKKISLLFLAILVVGIGAGYFLVFKKKEFAGKIYTSDIDLFLAVQERIEAGEDPVVAYQTYIDQGTVGVRDFIDNRIVSAEHLAKMVDRFPEIYEPLQEIRERLPSYTEANSLSFEKLKLLYPETVIPDTYFLVGGTNSGGTATDNGLLIGVEVFSRNPDIIPHIVAHELIHFQQSSLSYGTGSNLLRQSIIEGAGDYLGRLISDGIINDAAHDYGFANECQLWQEFQADMGGSDFGAWMYGKPEGVSLEWQSRPNDLGYFMGYKIIQSYFENAPSQKEAVDDLLNFISPENFLEKSKYPDKMAACN